MDNMDLKLKEIFTSTTLTKVEKILEAERILTDKLDVETTNSVLYFKLAVVVLEEPEVDFIQSIECMEKILSYDKTNIEAAIFLSWLQYFYRGYVNSGTITLLDSLLESVEMDSLSRSLIYFAKSWSNEIDEEESNCFLEKSVESDMYVENCLRLATSYRNKGDLDKEQDLLLTVLRKVEMIYLMDESFRLAAVKSYLSDRFKGIINIPTYDMPTYNTLKKEFILRNVIDSHTVSDIFDRLKTLSK